jgi:hypothetical protein
VRSTLIAIALIGVLIFVSGGFKGQNSTPKLDSPRKTERPEPDCRKTGDKVCVLPDINGKDRFYCYSGPWPKIVKARNEC